MLNFVPKSNTSSENSTAAGISRVAIIGLGHVGLPTAVLFANAGLDVSGVDINERLVDNINASISPVVEPGLEAILSQAIDAGRLHAAITPAPADAFVVAVPTPIQEDGTHAPDISHVLAAIRAVAPVLRRGNLLVLESTSPVGTTRQCVDLIGSLRPDLKMPDQDSDGDIDVAYSPERVLPGNALAELVNNRRVVGGVTPRAAQRAAALFSAFVRGGCLITDDRSAEMVKLAENIYRDVNIAFANELSMICNRLGLDVRKIIDLANHHPRVEILSPGPGVGGHCIPVDPWFVIAQTPEEARLIRVAREVNEEKRRHVVDLVRVAATKGDGSRIACFGLSYKPDINDFRESPALEIALELTSEFPGRVVAVDPYAESLRAREKRAEQLALVPADAALAGADIVVMLEGHKEFKALPKPSGKTVIDTVGFWR